MNCSVVISAHRDSTLSQSFHRVPTDLFVESPAWKNMFENPVMAQFDHRVLVSSRSVWMLQNVFRSHSSHPAFVPTVQGRFYRRCRCRNFCLLSDAASAESRPCGGVSHGGHGDSSGTEMFTRKSGCAMIHYPLVSSLPLHTSSSQQITLGISTLLYFVPTPLAATHQGTWDFGSDYSPCVGRRLLDSDALFPVFFQLAHSGFSARHSGLCTS